MTTDTDIETLSAYLKQIRAERTDAGATPTDEVTKLRTTVERIEEVLTQPGRSDTERVAKARALLAALRVNAH